MAAPLVGRDHQLARVERHLTGPGQAAVIHGSEGVGKTRLAREVLARAEQRGYATIQLVATPSAASIPFAALAALLPATDGPIDDTASMIRACRSHLEEKTSSTAMVVLVDDAHWLDRGSLSLLQHLVALPRLRLLLTVRADAPAPAEITGLWKDELALRVDLDPLGRTSTERLVELTLGSPAHPATAETLWESSRGNPLFLRELLLAARELGHLVDRDGTWELTQALSITPRLADLVSTRVDGLDDSARMGLEALTLIEPLGSASFLRLLGAETVAQLEASETIEVTQVGRRRQVRFGHPVYGEVVRATTPQTRLGQVADLLLDTLPTEQASRRTDHAMLAKLWSIAGRPGRAELFIAAARQALSAADHVSAEEMASSAVDRGGGLEALLTYGEALVYRGRPDVAEQTLSSAADQATGNEHVARVALLDAHNALFNRGDPARADEVLVQASRQVEDPGWRDQLDATRALTAVMRGDMHLALEASDPVRNHDDPEPRVLLGVLTVSTVANTMLGNIAAARQDLARAAPLVEPLREALPLANDQIGITGVLTELHDAQVSEAVALAEKGYALALAAGMPGPSGAWAVALANASVTAGRMADAQRLTDEAEARLQGGDPLALRGTALSLGVLCAAALRDLRSAFGLLERLRTAGDGDLRTRIHTGRAEVWVTAARGDLQQACRLAAEHGRWAVDATHHVWGAMTLHDAVRFGNAAEVRADLVALSAEHDAGLLQLFADHAVAFEEQDADALRDVASRFSSGGAQLYAAEVMAQTADVLHRQGQRRAAVTAGTAASASLRRCGDVVTPALLRVEDPLTTREREIAIMARRGMSSPQIADALTLSPRTVDNHLAAIYRKTGIDGRHELDKIVLGDRGDAG